MAQVVFSSPISGGEPFFLGMDDVVGLEPLELSPGPKIQEVAQKVFVALDQVPVIEEDDPDEKTVPGLKRPRSPKASESESEEIFLSSKDEAPREAEKLENQTLLQTPASVKETLPSPEEASSAPEACQESKTQEASEEVAAPPANKRLKREDEVALGIAKDAYSIACCKEEVSKIIWNVFHKISPHLNFFKKTALHAYCSFRLPSHVTHANSYQALAELVEWYKEYIENPTNSEGVDKKIVEEVVALLSSLIAKIRANI